MLKSERFRTRTDKKYYWKKEIKIFGHLVRMSEERKPEQIREARTKEREEEEGLW